MADDSSNTLQTIKGSKRKKEERKLKRCSEEDSQESSDGTNEVLERMRDISRCFGVAGLFGGPKKRKIESHGGKVSLLEEWASQETLRSLPTRQKQQYVEGVSHEVLALLQQMKKLLVFSKNLHYKAGDKPQKKDLVLDVLLKDIKASPSQSIPERYRHLGLWSQVMQLNQRLPSVLEEVGVTDAGQNFDSSCETRLASSSQKEKDEPVAQGIGKPVHSFRDFYMDMVTSSFANDLDTLRKDSSFHSTQVSPLIDCLETGKDIWSDLDKSLLQHSSLIK